MSAGGKAVRFAFFTAVFFFVAAVGDGLRAAENASPSPVAPSSGRALLKPGKKKGAASSKARADGKRSGGKEAAAVKVQSPEAAAKVRRLIKRLGDERWPVRRRAAAALLALEEKALPALRKAADNPDPEIAARAIWLRLRLEGRGFLGIGLDERAGKPLPAEETEEEDGPSPLLSLRPLPPVPPKPAPRVVALNYASKEQFSREDAWPAEVAGLRPGDVITAVNGERLHGSLDLMRLISQAGPGTVVLLRLRRDGKELLLTAKLCTHPLDHPLLANRRHLRLVLRGAAGTAPGLPLPVRQRGEKPAVPRNK